MAYAAWPGTLPQYVLEGGYGEALPNNRIESPADRGPPKSRRRFTQNVRPIQFAVRCDMSQRTIFEDFYITTLASGTLPFTWVHPVTQVATTFQFTGSPPQYKVGGSGSFVDIFMSVVTLL